MTAEKVIDNINQLESENSHDALNYLKILLFSLQRSIVALFDQNTYLSSGK